jgi:hypothetical protein
MTCGRSGCGHGASDDAALGVARTCHRSILQPEPNASARDGLVRQAAKATTLDPFRSSARGQVRQLLQDRLQLGVPSCGGGFEQKIGKCLNQALEIRRRWPLGTVMFQFQSELRIESGC